ncbi:MAG TPA: hypothetical protein VFN67_12810 [Polyangiales bacterium]|nr:hypothetical protein [Polyangiales bacterium]
MNVSAPGQAPPTRWIGFPGTRTSKEDLGRLLNQQLTAAGASLAEVMPGHRLSAQKRLVEIGLRVALLPERVGPTQQTLSWVDTSRRRFTSTDSSRAWAGAAP